MSPRLHVFALFVAGSVVVGGLAPVLAQSLADVAREEEARRKQVKNPAKVYTNKDLGIVPPGVSRPAADPAKPTTSSTASSTSTTSTTSTGGAQNDAGKVTTTEPPKGEARDQAYWAGRVKDLTTQLDRDQSFADALQSRINALTADFSARDDPAQRDVIGRDRQKALDEFDRLKKAILADKKALADLQEEARRAGVSPGWLR